MSPQTLDPFNVTADLSMPTLAAALDPAEANAQFNRKLREFVGAGGELSVAGIEVTRHKPGKRCVVEYRVSIDRPGFETEHMTLIGKVRAKRFGKSGFRTLKAIWNAGFQSNSPDGVSVPEPIGTVGKFQMWIQRKVPGRVATELLATDSGPTIAKRIAAAAAKLHSCQIEFEATHDMAKELRILHERLPSVCAQSPSVRRRIQCILRDSDEIGKTLTDQPARPIHRDFYSDQIIVADNRLFLLDFDLCCQGSPAVDIGNFLAHITEQSVREHGHENALRHVERTLVDHFTELVGTEHKPAIDVYRLLTLVRHIYLSTIIPDRHQFTESLVELCERELTTWWRESLVR